MWRDSKRLLLLIGLAAVLVGAYLWVHGLPGAGRPEEPRRPKARRGPRAGAPTTRGGTGDSPPGNAGRNERNDSWTKLSKVSRMARRAEPEHLPALKKAAASKVTEIREAAVVGIGRMGKDSDPQVLIEALRKDRSAAVRIAAATALGRIRCWDAGEALMDALDDADTGVRSAAGFALTRIMGADLGYRANDPGRERIIQRIRHWWPKFYEGRNRGRGSKD